MVLDIGLGISYVRDILAVSGAHIDHWKCGFGTSVFTPLSVLKEKLSLLCDYDILTYPGGTLFEAAVHQGNGTAFIKRTRELGFVAIEISEGIIQLAGDHRRQLIGSARDAGLVVIAEVGRKDPKRQQTAAELVEEAFRDLEWGACWVIIEGRESGRSVGIYNHEGDVRSSFLDEIVELAGHELERFIWEAPLRSQQAALVRRFGPNVNLGNIDPLTCTALEALRCGLRFETFPALRRPNITIGCGEPIRKDEEPMVAHAASEI